MSEQFADAMAGRVLELERALRDARKKAWKLERSRDLWRSKALAPKPSPQPVVRVVVSRYTQHNQRWADNFRTESARA